MIYLRLLGGVELSTRDGGRDRRLNVAPKPLALLAYLAVASARVPTVRRDVLLALFWPELSTDRARGALRQLLFQLRRALGARALHADREIVSLVPDALSCDVHTFEQRLACGDRAGAMEVYRGALLEGFFVDGMSAALEEWITSERERLNWKAFLTSRALADEAERSGNGLAAAQWARTAVSLAPDNEIAVRRRIEILDAFGDRAGALRVADDFARRLSTEFGTLPSAETQTLIAAVRARGPSPTGTLADEVSMSEANPTDIAAAHHAEGPAPAREATPPSPRVRSRTLFTFAAAFIVVIGGGALFVARAGHGATPEARRASASEPPITIASPAARQLFAEGLKRYYAADARGSAHLFGAALANDSSCAMCAYYASRAYVGLDDMASARMLELAMRLASRVSEAERLFIHYRWADVTNGPSRTAVAESLVTRYPNWPEAQIAAAEAADMDAKWLVAAAHLRRALSMAPPHDTTAGDRCPVCAAEHQLYDTYDAADSLPTALRVAQEWVRVQPHARMAWLELSHALAASGRYDDARTAIDSSTRYASGTDEDAIEHAQIEIRAGNFDVADRLLTTLAETGNADSRNDALWYLVISLRVQGRLHDALRIIDGPMRRLAAASAQDSSIVIMARAQMLFDLGQDRRAALMFESAVTPRDSFSRAEVGRSARQHAWALTHAGSAVAAMGDTLELARLADSVEAWGKVSGFERDRRLHQYLRGLLWVARSQPESAVVSFRKAITSETQGFSRADLELARALLAVGRPREAIPLLQHPLRGTLEAGNFYASRTEIKEELAHAFDAAGQLDSAAVYYRDVIKAWQGADPPFHSRVATARAKLAIDERRIAAQH